MSTLPLLPTPEFDTDTTLFSNALQEEVLDALRDARNDLMGPGRKALFMQAVSNYCCVAGDSTGDVLDTEAGVNAVRELLDQITHWQKYKWVHITQPGLETRVPVFDPTQADSVPAYEQPETTNDKKLRERLDALSKRTEKARVESVNWQFDKSEHIAFVWITTSKGHHKYDFNEHGECNCPDAQYNGSLPCKHALARHTEIGRRKALVAA